MIFDLLHVRIRIKLLGLVLLPIVGGGLLSGLYVGERAQLYKRMKRVSAATGAAKDVGVMRHALQLESNRTALFLGAHKVEDQAPMMKARETSDQLRRQLEDRLRDITSQVGEVGDLQPLDGKALLELRNRSVPAGNGPEVLDGYTRATQSLLQYQGQLLLPMTGTPLEGRLQPFASLSRVEEYAGQTRALLTHAFATHGLAPGWQDRLQTLADLERTQVGAFLATAPAAIKAEYQKVAAEPQVVERGHLITEALAGRVPQDPSAWIAVSTAHLDGLRKLREGMGESLLGEAQSLEWGVQRNGMMLTVGFGMFGLLVLAWTWRATMLITRPIQDLADAMGRLREGDLTIQLPVHSHDETGQMTEVFNAMSAHLNELVRGLQGHADKVAASSAGLSHSVDQVGAVTQRLAQSARIQRESSQQMAEAVRILQKSVAEVKSNLIAMAEGGLSASTQARHSGRRVEDLSALLDQADRHIEAINKASGRVYSLLRTSHALLESSDGAASHAELGEMLKESLAGTDKIIQAGKAGTTAIQEGESNLAAAAHAMAQVESALGAIATLANELHRTMEAQVEASQAVNTPMEKSLAATGEVQMATAQLANTTPEVAITTRELTGVAQSMKAAAATFQVG